MDSATDWQVCKCHRKIQERLPITDSTLLIRHKTEVNIVTLDKKEDIRRKPLALDSLILAAIISPTNGRNIISVATTFRITKNTYTLCYKENEHENVLL